MADIIHAFCSVCGPCGTVPEGDARRWLMEHRHAQHTSREALDECDRCMAVREPPDDPAGRVQVEILPGVWLNVNRDDARLMLEVNRWKVPLEVIARAYLTVTELHLLSEWHEDDGAALWWKFPVTEPPYSGSPLDDHFPDYVTHWTKIVVPVGTCKDCRRHDASSSECPDRCTYAAEGQYPCWEPQTPKGGDHA